SGTGPSWNAVATMLSASPSASSSSVDVDLIVTTRSGVLLTVIRNPQLSMTRGSDARGSSPEPGSGVGTPAWSGPGVVAHAASVIATAARGAVSTARRARERPGRDGDVMGPPNRRVGARDQRDE